MSWQWPSSFKHAVALFCPKWVFRATIYIFNIVGMWIALHDLFWGAVLVRALFCVWSRWRKLNNVRRVVSYCLYVLVSTWSWWFIAPLLLSYRISKSKIMKSNRYLPVTLLVPSWLQLNVLVHVIRRWHDYFLLLFDKIWRSWVSARSGSPLWKLRHFLCLCPTT